MLKTRSLDPRRRFASRSVRWLLVAALPMLAACGNCGGGGGNPDGGDGGSPDGGDAGVLPTVTIGDVSLSEGQTGATTFSFEVSLDAAPVNDVTATWTTADGTAQAGSDFLAGSGQLTFTRGGPLTQTIAVEVSGDTEAEPDETFSVVLSALANATPGKLTGVGTILADEVPRMSIADATGPEGASGTSPLTFVVTLDREPRAGEPITVAWTSSDGSAAAGDDYQQASGTVTFAAGEGLSKSVEVQVIGDGVIEPDETFTVTLSAPVNAGLDRATAMGSITADDFPAVSIASAELTEGDSGTTGLSLEVSLSAAPPVGYPLQVQWATADGSATAPADYQTSAGTLTFSAGDPLTQSVTVVIAGDTAIEGPESFVVNLSSPSNGVLGATAGTATILDDDFPDVCIATGVSVVEGTGAGSTNLGFAVTLNAAPAPGSDVRVDWTTSGGTATPGADYTASSGSLTFTSAGPLSQTVAVPIVRDADVEPDETVEVTLSGAINATLRCATGTGTIVTDDQPKASISDAVVYEGDSGTTSASFTVTLSGAPLTGADAQLTWASAPGSAAPGSDFTMASGALTFVHGGPLSQVVTVTVNGDTLVEPDELFLVTLTATANVSVDEGTGLGTIRDDEVPAVTIDDVTVLEGNSGTTPWVFTVSVFPAPAPGKDVSVSWATGNRTASSPNDFAAASGSLTFTSGGPTSATVTVNVVGEATKEVNEEFAVNLSGVVNGRIRDAIGIGTVVDDDGAIIRVDPTGSGADGLSWATAYQTVQAGVDRVAALGGGQVWLAAGRYGNGASTVLDLKAGVAVIGGFDGYRGGAGAQEQSYFDRDLLRYVVTLDGGGQALHTVRISGANTVLDGVKVIGGNAIGTASPDNGGGGLFVAGSEALVVRSAIAGNAAATNGGGIYVNAGAARIRDSRLYSNRVSGCNNGGGGGLYHSNSGGVDVLDTDFKANAVTCYYGGGFNGWSGTYRYSRFVGNTARHGAGGQSIFGPITLRDCQFIANRAEATSGGYENNSWANDRIYDSTFMRNTSGGQGGGLMLRDSSAWLVNSRVEENVAQVGGGLFIWDYFGGVQQLVQVRIANNRATTTGGGIAIQQAAPVLTEVVLEGNSAGQYGGGIHNYGGSPTIRDSTFVNDVAPSGLELYNAQLPGTTPIPSNPVASNTILWNRTSGLPSVVTTAGSSFTSSFMSLTDRGDDAQFVQVPVRTARASAGTVSTLNIASADTLFAVNDVVEVQDDGVARAVVAVTATQLTFAPALAAAPPANVRVDNWGAVPASLEVDLRLQATSACIDSGDNTQVGADVTDLDGDGNTSEPVPFDFHGRARFVDDPAADTGSGTAPLVDIGATER